MMLARKGGLDDLARLEKAGWMFDLKIDGIRCQAFLDKGSVRLVSREGVDITDKYPEVVAALRDAFGTTQVVLDGEIAVTGDNGYPRWADTIKRHAQQKAFKAWSQWLPAKFYVFDVLEFDHRDLRSAPYVDRRTVLVTELEPVGAISYTPCTRGAAVLWQMVEEHGLEGVVAKRPGSRYRTGRSADWIKVKRRQTVTCAVGGVQPGKGGRAATFGALELFALNDDRDLVPIGEVGTGFKDRDLVEVMQHLTRPPLIVEVTYMDFNNGRLREPVFKRIRDDATLADCTLDQLT